MITGPLVALFSPVKALSGAGTAAKDAAAAAKDAEGAAKAAQHAAADAKTVPQAEAAIGVADSQSLRNFAGAHSGTSLSRFPHAIVSPKIEEELRGTLFIGRPEPAKRRLKRDLSLQHRSSHRLQKRGPPNILAYVRHH